MPYEIKFTDDGGVLTNGAGVFTDKDLITSTKQIYRDDEQIRNISYQVWDLSSCERIEVTTDGIVRVSELDKGAFNINPEMRIAVFGQPEVVYGLGRMWQVYACEMSGHEKNCHIFRDRDDILKWVRPEEKNPHSS